jgi:hypothetical protein
MVEALFADEELRCVFLLEPAVRDRYLLGRSRLGQSLAGTESSLARSYNATSTNSASVGLIERSGFTDAVAAAVQGARLLATDENAATVNLSGFGRLKKRARDEKLPSAARYREQGWANRLAGSFTFGAKLPEKDIVGFSGFPDSGKLFDALGWDAKVRLIGDRDPRAARWDNQLLGLLGGEATVAASLLGAPGIPIADRQSGGALNEAITERVTTDVEPIAKAIRRSLQVSVKVAGQHLATEAGMDKYSGVLMVDQGFGVFDLTANLAYNAVQKVQTAGTAPFTLKNWKLAGGFVGTVWKDVIVNGLGVELALSGELVVPIDGKAHGLDRHSTWKTDVALKIPVATSVQLPFSITYSNDPNNLVKQRYVSGRLGVNYDFGSLKKLIAGQ